MCDCFGETCLGAGRVVAMLMHGEVELRRDFIESNAPRAANIDA
jgi:DNA gyrase/topoisomerase IV subunit B